MRDLTSFRGLSGGPFQFFDDSDRDMRKIFTQMNGRSGADYSGYPVAVPACDVSDKDSHYVLSFDLPGVSKEDIEVEFSNGQLRVCGERCSEYSEDDYSARSFGRYERVISVPTDIQADEIEAYYENGVLKVAIPKSERSSSKRIPISEDKKEGLWGRLLGHRNNKNKEEKKSVPVESGKVA